MLVRRLARPLLASIFLTGGIAQLRHPAAHAETAAKVTPLLTKAGLPLSQDTTTLVKANGAAMTVGGLLLALGKAPRLASLGLLASLIPTTITHDFWAQSDPQAKQAQQVQFVKNLSIAGGLLLAAVDLEGRPGLGYRTKLAGKSVERGTRAAKKAAKREAKIAALTAKSAVG